jgi:Alpha/beta hydrolase
VPSALHQSALSQTVAVGLPSVSASVFAPPASVSSTPAVAPATVSLTGVPFLDTLSTIPVPSVKNYLSSNTTAVHALLASPPTAAAVSGWWTALTPSSRSALVSSAPDLVGNLNGIPYSVRSSANLSYLNSQIASLTAEQQSERGRSIDLSDARHVHMLEKIKDALETPSGGAPRSLLSLNADGFGTAAIVIGNLDTAQNVGFLVPGMFFSVDSQIVDWTKTAQRYYDQQRSLLSTLGDQDKSIAAVAWIGYQTPSLENVGSADLALTGKVGLSEALTGLYSARVNHEPFVTVVAHSYGSTAALLALQQYGVSADALVLIGSPGSDVQKATDLHVPRGNVYVGEDDWDPIPNSSFFGTDPGSASFGAKQLATNAGVDAVTGASLVSSIGHNGYFTPSSMALRNLALVGLDRGDLVTTVGSTSTTTPRLSASAAGLPSSWSSKAD